MNTHTEKKIPASSTTDRLISLLVNIDFVEIWTSDRDPSVVNDLRGVEWERVPGSPSVSLLFFQENKATAFFNAYFTLYLVQLFAHNETFCTRIIPGINRCVPPDVDHCCRLY